MSPSTSHILQHQVLPRLKSSMSSVPQIGAEDPDELVQDATVMAAKMMERLEQQQKQVTPGNIAYYTIQHLKSGRRASGSNTVDVYAPGTQLNGRTELHSINEVVSQSEAGDEVFELQDVISNDYEDPGTQAARTLDWNWFCQHLSQVEKLLLECLGNGLGIKQAAELGKVDYSTMQNYRKKIASKLLEFMGCDILQEISNAPAWRISLDCERELMACRADRRSWA